MPSPLAAGAGSAHADAFDPRPQPRSASSSERQACHAAGSVSRGCGTATVAAMARTASPRSATIGASARRAPSRSGLDSEDDKSKIEDDRSKIKSLASVQEVHF